MILEGLVTTTNADGTPHLAPMGPLVMADMQSFTLRPFPTSHTYQNLLTHGEGVFHVTDDVLLLAKAAVGKATMPRVNPANEIRGWVLEDCCRYYEFRVIGMDDTTVRITIIADVVRSGRFREFFGFNRAKHAVLEAAILATRLHMLPKHNVEVEFAKLRTIVGKTGGPAEHEAMDFLDDYLAHFTVGP